MAPRTPEIIREEYQDEKITDELIKAEQERERAKGLVHEFLVAYANWMNNGAPDARDYGGDSTLVFYRSYGLCASFERYLMKNTNMDDSGRNLALYELKWTFFEDEDGELRDPDYPFGGKLVFDMESVCRSMHLNPQRRAFVFKHSGVAELNQGDSK
jgi:hypothetical protein